MVPFALLLGVGPLVRWGRDRPRKIRNLFDYRLHLCSGAVAAVAVAVRKQSWAMTVLGWQWPAGLRCWQLRKAALRISRGTKTTFSYWGWWRLTGLAVTIVGIAFSQNYSVERDVRMKSGDSVDIHEYRFTFRDVKEVTWSKLAWRWRLSA